MKKSDVLQNARQVLIKKGWCQGIFETADGRRCLSGALIKATNDYDLRHDARETIKALFDTNTLIVSWNDDPNRTVEEVLQLLDDATSMAMSEEACNE